MASHNILSVDDSSYLFGFCANRGYWGIAHSTIVRFLILILLIFGLLLHFLAFFSLVLLYFPRLVFGFCFFLDHIILFALKKRGDCSLKIFTFCVFFSIFIWPLKTLFLIVFFVYIMAGQCGLRNSVYPLLFFFIYFDLRVLFS